MEQTEKKHIAVAEDEVRILRSISLMLIRAGYVVSKAETGTELISVVLSARSTDCPVDLILCDFNMPNATGLQVLHELETNAIKVPVVIMTGLSEEEILAKLEAAGCSYFLMKPFSPEELIQTVEKALNWD